MQRKPRGGIVEKRAIQRNIGLAGKNAPSAAKRAPDGAACAGIRGEHLGRTGPKCVLTENGIALISKSRPGRESLADETPRNFGASIRSLKRPAVPPRCP